MILLKCPLCGKVVEISYHEQWLLPCGHKVGWYSGMAEVVEESERAEREQQEEYDALLAEGRLQYY